jgi:hypothetical protein
MGADEQRGGELLLAGLDALLRGDLSSADVALVRLERGEGSPLEYHQLLDAFRREVAR